MISISSFKPFEKCAPEIIANQISANISWRNSFDKIFYFNRSENQLSGIFLIQEGRPAIKSMALFASKLSGWSCIVNADIQVSEKIKQAEIKLNEKNAKCAISRRFQIPENKIMDGGLDFFAATPKVWGAVSKAIDEKFCLGRIVWDTWMLNFFVTEFNDSCYDITATRCIFHPKHGDRQDQNFDYPKNDPYLLKSRWPILKI